MYEMILLMEVVSLIVDDLNENVIVKFDFFRKVFLQFIFVFLFFLNGLMNEKQLC